MVGFDKRVEITPENIDKIKSQLPLDQAEQLKQGCSTWNFNDKQGKQAGNITLWPEGIAAINYRENTNQQSSWGKWDEVKQTLDLQDQGMQIDKEGIILSRPALAIQLTEEQTRLLLSAEYPNDGRTQTTALNEIMAGNPISIENESVLLDYSHDTQTFFAKLDAQEKPALDAKLQQLQLQQERDKFPPTQNRQHERTMEHSRSMEHEL